MSVPLDIVASGLRCGDLFDDGSMVVAIMTNHGEREVTVTTVQPGWPGSGRVTTVLEFDDPLRVTRGATPIVRVN